MRIAVASARRSTCGRLAGTTRCCVYSDASDTTGHCGIMKATSCETHLTTSAIVIGPGSCLPSPCTR
jgi:hypothetical protein